MTEAFGNQPKPVQDRDRVLAELGSLALNDGVLVEAGHVETIEIRHQYGQLPPLVNVA